MRVVEFTIEGRHLKLDADEVAAVRPAKVTDAAEYDGCEITLKNGCFFYVAATYEKALVVLGPPWI